MASNRHPDDMVDDLDDLDHDPPDDRGAAKRFFDWCWDITRSWGPALLAVLLIRSVIAEPFRIPSGSMVPTLAIGDHILVTKYSYGLRIPLTHIPLTERKVPDRGDVVVFVFPPTWDEDSLSYWLDLPLPGIATYDYVKRIVGLPGDTIEVKNGTLYINGKPQQQSYADGFTFTDDQCQDHATKRFKEDLEGVEHDVLYATIRHSSLSNWGPETVPQGHVFAMGDNRDHSSDSRVWGYVPLRNIKGKARFVWLSYDQCKPGLPIIGTFRGERFGEPVR